MRANRFSLQLKKELLNRLASFAILHLIIAFVIGLVSLIIIIFDRAALGEVIVVLPVILTLIFIPFYLLVIEGVSKGASFCLYITHQQTRASFQIQSAVTRLAHFAVCMTEAALLTLLFAPLIEQAMQNQKEFEESDRILFNTILHPSPSMIAIYALILLLCILLGSLLANVWIASPKAFSYLWIVFMCVMWAFMLTPDSWLSVPFSRLFGWIGALPLYGIALLLAAIAAALTAAEQLWTKRLSVSV